MKLSWSRPKPSTDRQQELIKQNATSTSNVEKWRSSRDQAQAQVELAKINLGYTRVTAPFAGRIGQRLVDPGNLVGTGSPTKLATLDQLLPIYVNFNLNERDALQMREAMRKLGMEAKSAVGKAPVEVGLSNEKGYPHEGVLDFVDNEISGSTGTIAMRAIFKNEDKTLFPGVFARVRIPLGDPKPMLVIPNSAIGNDQQGDYVFLVDANDVVVRQTIVKGPLTPSGDCAIRSGLTAADRVVVNGILNARPGQKVAPTESAHRNSRRRDALTLAFRAVMFAKFFIERPVLANVIACVMILLGAVAVFVLPVSEYPPITPPTVQVTTTYPGASAKILLETVALPSNSRSTAWKRCSTCSPTARAMGVTP